jgi:phosphoglycerol transferase MdoB-like AlkP superfamily enzyme
MGSKIWKHPWVVAACNFALMMAIFSLSRLFYYLTNTATYPDVSGSHLWELLGGGVRFDLTALLYLNSVYLLLELFPLKIRQHKRYQQVAQWFYWIPNGLAIAINCFDMVYMQFTGRRTTIAFFTEFENDSNLASIFFTAAAQYWYVTLFAIVMIAAMVLLTRREVETDDRRHLIIYYITETALLLVSVYFVVIGIRGGFGAFTRPITLSNALAYTNHPNETNIVLNTPFAIMRSTEGKTFPNVVYYPEEELETVMSPIHPAPAATPMQPKNVVIFILESFSKEYFGYYNHDMDGGTYKGYTPFLDSLAAKSLTFELSFANGRKSIDAMPSILSSIPMIITPYILTPYSTNDVGSIASYLGAKGWQTGFFHGAPNGSMGFQAYARSCGFDAYYGKDEYNNNADYDGYWAIWDEEFLQFFGRTMSEMRQPFMTAVFTATSHHPFQVPKRYEGVFPEGTHPLHKCIGYTDHALRRFFDYAKQQDWYENTLFVLTADHTNALTYADYETDKGRFEVPIIFFDPQMNEEVRTRKRDFPVAQVDIMPSILGYLGYDEPYFAFGEDVITKDKEVPFVVNYNNPVYQIFSDSVLVQFDGQNVTGVYNFLNDRRLKVNLKDEYTEDEMLRYLKATIQQYISRMRENRVHIGE